MVTVDIPNDRINLPVSLSAAITNAITVDAWVWAATLDEPSIYRAILSENYLGDWDVEFSLHVNGSGQNLRAGYYTNGWYLVADTNSFPTGRWVRVTGVFSGTNMVLYKDGLQVDSQTMTVALPNGTNGWRIGQRHDNVGTPADYWHGKIDELRVYSSALSSNQVANMYDAFLDLDGDGLTNAEEYQFGSDPGEVDSDGDGLSDWDEVMTYGSDPRDWDSDDDLLADGAEVSRYQTSPTNWQTAGDGIVDWYKKLMGDPLPGVAYRITNLVAVDGCMQLTVVPTTTTNSYEFFYTDNLFVPWLLAETSVSGQGGTTLWNDCGGVERVAVAPYRFYTMGLADDFDGDGLGSAYEVFMLGTSPDMPDSNGNMTDDGEEDFDGDGLTNAEEYGRRTHPWVGDTDGDGMNDGDEVELGSEPLVADRAIISIGFPVNGQKLP